MSDTSGRMLRLLSLLQTHRFWPGTELASRLEVSDRTLRRDIDRLRSLGYIVEGTRGLDGGYRLAAGADLPPLLLEDEEAVAIAFGLRSVAGGSISGIDEASVRALAKLEQVLPSRLRDRVRALQSATVSMPTWGPTVDSSVLTVIAQACRDTVRVQFDYVAAGGDESTRVVEPNRLVSAGRRWYLVGWDTTRSDWRTFRVDRIASRPVALTRFNPRELPAADAAAFLAAAFDQAFSAHRVVATVAASHDTVTAAFYPGDGAVEPIDDHSCRVYLTGSSIEWLAVSLCMIGHDFVVEEPPELIDHVRVLAERLTAATRPAG
ncbi:MAG: helix-turn-helix transcriptional regulator [Acidimicrobiales bacterium]